MFRYILATFFLAMTVVMTGCVLGPGGGHCRDCDGLGQPVGYSSGPIDSLRQWRRGLTCGNGCGEVYVDEWSSTPPDCEDPCPQFAGGGCGGGGCGGPDCLDICGCGDAGCGGGCGFRPLRAVGAAVVGIYGKRFCGGCGYDIGECGCGDTDPYASYGSGCDCASCGGGGGGTVISGGGGGCANGNCSIDRGSVQTQQVVSNAGSGQSMARQKMMRRQSMSRQATQVADSRTQQARPQPAQKFYRNAQQLQPGQPAFRR